MFKQLPFNAGKTAHLDRLYLENSLKESKANFSQLFVVKNLLSKHKCFVTKLEIMFKEKK